MATARIVGLASVTLAALLLGGCSSGGKLTRCNEEITALRSQMTTLQAALDEERNRSRGLEGDLQAALDEYQRKEQLLVTQNRDLSVVSISSALLFKSGSVTMTEEGKRLLNNLSTVLSRHPDREVRIEGHTDNVPIAARYQHKYRSNWELSSARSHAVLLYLVGKGMVEPQRIAVVGYGEYRPVADNLTDSGRAQNRRVVIVIGPSLSAGRSTTAESTQHEGFTGSTHSER